MTRTLALLRHAKSAWPDGVPDLERPLGERGLRDAPAVGRWLAQHLAGLELAVCSPALRARRTWELASAELSVSPEVKQHAKVYYGPVLDVIRDIPAETGTALVVGHNPDLEDLAELLSDEPVTFKTSTVAVLRTELPWAQADRAWAQLISVDTPRG